MKAIALKDARPGMVLARRIEDSLGRTLVSAGEQVNVALIRVLMRRGFTEIEICHDTASQSSTGPGDSGPRYTRKLTELEQELQRRFGLLSESDEPRRMLRAATLRVLSERLVR